MSLEKAIADNTAALNSLCEVVKSLFGNLPPTGTAPVTEPVRQKEQVSPVSETNQPSAETKPAESGKIPTPAETPQTTPTIDFDALRKALSPKIQKLYMSNPVLGSAILSKFGIGRLKELADEQLPAFAQEIDKALQGA